MTDLKMESVSGAADRPLRRSRLGGLVERVGTHNFSLLIALAALIAIFGSLRPDVFFLLRNILNIGQAIAILGILATAQTIVIISGGTRYIGRRRGRPVDGLHRPCGRMDRFACPQHSVRRGGRSDRRARQRTDRHGRTHQRRHRHPRHDGRVPRRRIHHLERPVDQHFRSPAFQFIGDGKILGLPVTILVLVIVVAIFFVLMRYTITGRNIYAIGGNPVVARLAGLNVRAYQVGIYTLSGATAGLAGMLLAARTGSGQPISGSEGLELEAITAAVLGGCALTGGKGTIIGGLLGVLIIGVLDNGLILTSVPTFFQMVAKGVLLIAAVIIAEQQARRYG